MSKETEVKRHIDCNWLMQIGKGSFKCCDARGAFQGKALSKEDAHKPACEFIHLKYKQINKKEIQCILE